MIRNSLIIIFGLMLNLSLYSQVDKPSEEPSEVDIILDELFDDEEKEGDKSEINELLDLLYAEQKELASLMKDFSNFQFLYFSVNYNNDTYFSGRDIGLDQFNIRPQITYMNSNGFFGSLSGIYYSEFDPKWDFTSVSLGYGKSVGKHKLIRLTSSYTRYFYSKGVESSFTNGITLGAGIRNKKRTIGTRISATSSFGSDSSIQVSSGTYVRVKLLKDKKSSLYFQPRMNITIGDQTFYQESGTVFSGGFEYINYVENNVFDFINVQFNFPLLLTVNDFDFELGYSYNLPQDNGSDTVFENTSFFNFSLAYLFEL